MDRPHSIRNGRLVSHAPDAGDISTILLLQPRAPGREDYTARPLHTPACQPADTPATDVLPEAVVRTVDVLSSNSVRQPDDDTRCIAAAHVPEASNLCPPPGFSIPADT